MNKEDVKILLKNYHDGTCTAEESAWVESWYNFRAKHNTSLGVDESLEQRMGEIWSTVLTQLPPKKKLYPLWKKVGSIAAAVAVVLFGVWFFTSRQEVANDALANDIAPGKNGATLTLANGQKILINDALAGNIATQAGVKISKTADGQIIYEITNDNSGKIAYNTLSTTRGEQTQVRLPDGTLVFLNAESSLKYPTSFSRSNKRQVVLTGEGYFEVAKDKVHPFIVKTERQEVEVLGTHFNVNSYGNEPIARTTLLEGSVKVTHDLTSRILKPNQQALFATNSEITITDVNGDKAIAWKNGKFEFVSENIESIMRQIGRWYNVEIIYKVPIKDKQFTGSFNRFENVSTVLQTIQRTNTVSFEIQGRRIIVME